MVLTRKILLKTLRRLYWVAKQDPVDDELRGWNWDRPPVKPRAYFGLGVSEVSSKYCPTRRDVWLRRVVKAKPDYGSAPQLRFGKVVHQIIHWVFTESRKMLTLGYPGWIVYEELSSKTIDLLRELGVGGEKWAIDFYKTVLLAIASEAEEAQAINGSIPAIGWTPWVTECKVDGSYIGLSSSLSIDALTEGGVIVEFKYGKPASFHKLTLAGYSLALEANLEVPFDYGILVYINGIPSSRPKISVKPVYISNELRRWFLDERDEIIDMLLSEMEPPKPASCPMNCPFRGVCGK